MTLLVILLWCLLQTRVKTTRTKVLNYSPPLGWGFTLRMVSDIACGVPTGYSLGYGTLADQGISPVNQEIPRCHKRGKSKLYALSVSAQDFPVDHFGRLDTLFNLRRAIVVGDLVPLEGGFRTLEAGCAGRDRRSDRGKPRS
jgi:hypothetical protein